MLLRFWLDVLKRVLECFSGLIKHQDREQSRQTVETALGHPFLAFAFSSHFLLGFRQDMSLMSRFIDQSLADDPHQQVLFAWT